MVTIASLLQFVVYVVVIGLILWLLSWLVDYAAPPEPWRKVARVVLTVVGMVILINLLLGLIGRPVVVW